MLMRPETPGILDRLRDVDAKHLKRTERLEKIYPRALVALASTALLGGAYWADVRHNQEVQDNASIRISVVGEPLDPANNHSGVIFLDGFGTYNANLTAKYMGPVAQEFVDGQILSVSYGNAPLSAKAIAKEVISLTPELGIDEISIVGNSQGGVTGTESAAYISELDDSLRIDMLGMISSPSGRSELRKDRQWEMDILKFAASIPGAKYSTPVRFAGEMFIRRDQYDVEPIRPSDTILDILSKQPKQIIDFWTTVGNVASDLQKKQSAGTWLLVDQALAIENADFENQFSRIAENSQIGERPTVVYFGTAKPGYDYMVNNKKSSENICSYATEVDLQCFVYNVPGAVHTQPWKAHDEYMKVAADAAPEVKLAMANELALLVMKQLDQPKHIG